MLIEFFNFINSETYHVFKWGTECPSVDLQALIAEAFRLAEEEDPLEIDTCHTVRDRLAELLQHAVIDLTPDGDAVFDNELGDASDPDKYRALWLPLMALTIKNVAWKVAAEAMLIRAGK
jgi:hypothetical protein